jgi:hypothetical protein
MNVGRFKRIIFICLSFTGGVQNNLIIPEKRLRQWATTGLPFSVSFGDVVE